MQEEVNEKTISLCIKGGKITAKILKAALIKLLAEMDKKKKQQEKGKGQCKRTGKQSIKSLQKSGAQIMNIVVTDNNIKSFDRVARKYGIENRESERARAYGRYQNVFLTDEELADLQASFPTVWGQYIEKLSEYMASTGKRYQSHAATIRRWAGEDAKKAAPPTRNRDYSVKEDETV